MEAQQHKELFISARRDFRVEPRSSKTKRVQVEEATPGLAEIKKQRLCKVKDSSRTIPHLTYRTSIGFHGKPQDRVFLFCLCRFFVTVATLF